MDTPDGLWCSCTSTETVPQQLSFEPTEIGDYNTTRNSIVSTVHDDPTGTTRNVPTYDGTISDNYGTITTMCITNANVETTETTRDSSTSWTTRERYGWNGTQCPTSPTVLGTTRFQLA